MTDYLQVWHARVPEGSVEKLLDLRPDAIAEAKRLCPELRAANLVRLEDGTWLDVLRWSCPDGEERLLRDAEHFDALHKMHELLETPSRSAGARSSRRPADGLGRGRRCCRRARPTSR